MGEIRQLHNKTVKVKEYDILEFYIKEAYTHNNISIAKTSNNICFLQFDTENKIWKEIDEEKYYEIINEYSDKIKENTNLTDKKVDALMQTSSTKHKIKRAFEFDGITSAKTNLGYIHKSNAKKTWKSEVQSEQYYGIAYLDYLMTGKKINIENYGEAAVIKIICNNSIPSGIIDTGNYHIEYDSFSEDRNQCVKLYKGVIYDIFSKKIISKKGETLNINILQTA